MPHFEKMSLARSFAAFFEKKGVFLCIDTSGRMIVQLDKEKKVFTENRNPKSLMAFGAMGAHINMALQALKATKSDQWRLITWSLLHKKLKELNVLLKKYN